jgi:hypothetical protein
LGVVSATTERVEPKSRLATVEPSPRKKVAHSGKGNQSVAVRKCHSGWGEREIADSPPPFVIEGEARF